MVRALVVSSKDAVADFADLPLSDFPDHPVTVRITHSSMNYKDALALTGRSPIVRAFPMVLGIDLAGIVETDGSSRFANGDAILATGYGLGELHWGGYSEVARLKPEWVVRRPPGLAASDAMSVGTAGLTAMLCLQALEDFGLRPEHGPVLVTGAAGGVGSLAVFFLARAGFTVAAATGRPGEETFLRSLGASEIVDRGELLKEPKMLGKERWAGAVDVAGGVVLANVLAGIRYGGAVAACGLVNSMSLPASVAPFILRGVALLGVDSVQTPADRRQRAWARIAGMIEPDRLRALTSRHAIDDAKQLAPVLLAGEVRGRVVLDVSGRERP